MTSPPSRGPALGTVLAVVAGFLVSAGVLLVTLVPVVRCTTCRILDHYDELILTGSKDRSLLPPPAQRPPCSHCDNRKKMTLVKYWLRK